MPAAKIIDPFMPHVRPTFSPATEPASDPSRMLRRNATATAALRSEEWLARATQLQPRTHPTLPPTAGGLSMPSWKARAYIHPPPSAIELLPPVSPSPPPAVPEIERGVWWLRIFGDEGRDVDGGTDARMTGDADVGVEEAEQEMMEISPTTTRPSKVGIFEAGGAGGGDAMDTSDQSMQSSTSTPSSSGAATAPRTSSNRTHCYFYTGSDTAFDAASELSPLAGTAQTSHLPGTALPNIYTQRPLSPACPTPTSAFHLTPFPPAPHEHVGLPFDPWILPETGRARHTMSPVSLTASPDLTAASSPAYPTPVARTTFAA